MRSICSKENRWRTQSNQDNDQNHPLVGSARHHATPSLIWISACCNWYLKPRLKPRPGAFHTGVRFILRHHHHKVQKSFQTLANMQTPRRSFSSTTTEHGPESTSRGPEIDSGMRHHFHAADGAQRTAGSVEDRTDSWADTSTPPVEGLSFPSRILLYFLVELDPRRADVVLIVCGFVSGLVDGLSFNAWGNFSSMQTGLLSASCNASYLS